MDSSVIAARIVRLVLIRALLDLIPGFRIGARDARAERPALAASRRSPIGPAPEHGKDGTLVPKTHELWPVTTDPENEKLELSKHFERGPS
jgi:hypothetical protein